MSTRNFEFKRDADGKPLWHAPLPNEAFDPRPYQPDNRPFSVCQLCGDPWPCAAAVERTAPVPVTGIWLRDQDEGRTLEVLAEMDGEWRIVIRTHNIEGNLISHIVEPLGMRHAKKWPTETPEPTEEELICMSPEGHDELIDGEHRACGCSR